ncbi:MAG: NAD(P)-dependent oxidoreductase [Planctomycetes bacterium]|nr:NAD(P)-dependent oxidoreductase [Planctomycetota bacterium]
MTIPEGGLQSMRILLTGAAGKVGSELRRLLRPDFGIRSVDIRPVEGEADAHVADIAKLDQLLPLMTGMDAVAHLAITSTRTIPDYNSDAYWEAQLDVNVKGTFNVFEAARRAGVRKVVYMSSLTTVFGYPRDRYIDRNTAALPDSVYALTKQMGEQVGELYSRMHGISAICFRLGCPVDAANLPPQTQTDKYYRSLCVSFDDIAQAYRLALLSKDIPFGVYNLLSDNPESLWDLSATREALGYRPKHSFTPAGVKTKG